MSTVDNSQDRSTPPTTKSRVSGSEKYVFGIVILVLAALGTYQVFFCPDCYAQADRTAVQGTLEP